MKEKPSGTPGNWTWGEGVEPGQSTGGKTGTDVVFDSAFRSTPKVSLTAWSTNAIVWLTATSTTGFSWCTDKDDVTIDWIATG